MCLESKSQDFRLFQLVDAQYIETLALLKTLSVDQLKTLICLCKNYLNQSACFDLVESIFEKRKDIEAIVDLCCLLGIDMDQFNSQKRVGLSL